MKKETFVLNNNVSIIFILLFCVLNTSLVFSDTAMHLTPGQAAATQFGKNIGKGVAGTLKAMGDAQGAAADAKREIVERSEKLRNCVDCPGREKMEKELDELLFQLDYLYASQLSVYSNGRGSNRAGGIISKLFGGNSLISQKCGHRFDEWAKCVGNSGVIKKKTISAFTGKKIELRKELDHCSSIYFKYNLCRAYDWGIYGIEPYIRALYDTQSVCVDTLSKNMIGLTTTGNIEQACQCVTNAVTKEKNVNDLPVGFIGLATEKNRFTPSRIMLTHYSVYNIMKSCLAPLPYDKSFFGKTLRYVQADFSTTPIEEAGSLEQKTQGRLIRSRVFANSFWLSKRIINSQNPGLDARNFIKNKNGLNQNQGILVCDYNVVDKAPDEKSKSAVKSLYFWYPMAGITIEELRSDLPEDHPYNLITGTSYICPKNVDSIKQALESVDKYKKTNSMISIEDELRGPDWAGLSFSNEKIPLLVEQAYQHFRSKGNENAVVIFIKDSKASAVVRVGKERNVKRYLDITPRLEQLLENKRYDFYIFTPELDSLITRASLLFKPNKRSLKFPNKINFLHRVRLDNDNYLVIHVTSIKTSYSNIILSKFISSDYYKSNSRNTVLNSLENTQKTILSMIKYGTIDTSNTWVAHYKEKVFTLTLSTHENGYIDGVVMYEDESQNRLEVAINLIEKGLGVLKFESESDSLDFTRLEVTFLDGGNVFIHPDIDNYLNNVEMKVEHEYTLIDWKSKNPYFKPKLNSLAFSSSEVEKKISADFDSDSILMTNYQTLLKDIEVFNREIPNKKQEHLEAIRIKAEQARIKAEQERVELLALTRSHFANVLVGNWKGNYSNHKGKKYKLNFVIEDVSEYRFTGHINIPSWFGSGDNYQFSGEFEYEEEEDRVFLKLHITEREDDTLGDNFHLWLERHSSEMNGNDIDIIEVEGKIKFASLYVSKLIESE